MLSLNADSVEEDEEDEEDEEAVGKAEEAVDDIAETVVGRLRSFRGEEEGGGGAGRKRVRGKHSRCDGNNGECDARNLAAERRN